ncbi:hypothetical protein RIF23_09355 [Lipingzhangella sp. LS1_29]|uniref:Uncharacterized protein n=1 Tax=Lipingzhangella rawalii TaxID=2055835 RepID=A0ABU2H5D3_9ACTN|nr:hypothetical protein [Lipingzhangella rawalii]MDS1270501.1 hypothetical protein [Lipingzhangella rawalii]
MLPGPGFVKFVLFLGLLGAAAYGLWFHAFPWVDPYLPFNDVTVGDAEGGGGQPGEGGDLPYGDGDEDDIVGVDEPLDGGQEPAGEGEEAQQE